jgi:hypothetical protein
MVFITSSMMPLSAVWAISRSLTATLRPVFVSLPPGFAASITSSLFSIIPESRKPMVKLFFPVAITSLPLS